MSATAWEMRKRWCRYCGKEIMGDDAGGWLHAATMQRPCDFVFVATPPIDWGNA